MALLVNHATGGEWPSAATWTGKANMLIVKCRNRRTRSVADGNGSREIRKNADCMKLLGRIADIDGRALEKRICGILDGLKNGVTVKEAAAKLLVAVFCQTFKASYFCPACRVFMDISFDNPGYTATSEPLGTAEFGKIMVPKIGSQQIEVA